MIKKILPCLVVCFFLFSCTYPQNDDSDLYDNLITTEKPTLNIKSYSIKDSYDSAIIYGEVENTGTIGAYFVRIDATIKDSLGTILDTDYTYLDPYALPEESCYGFTMYTDALYSATATVDMSVSYSGLTTDNPESGLTLSNVSESTVTYIHILGEITNNSSELKTYCRVDAIFYDETGKVIYCDYTYADPSSIGANYTNSFEIYTYLLPSEYSTYRVYATSSDNY